MGLSHDSSVDQAMAEKFLNVEMDNQIAATDIQGELEKRYEQLALAEKAKSDEPHVQALLDPVLDPPIPLLPVTQKTLEELKVLIPSWMRRNEL